MTREVDFDALWQETLASALPTPGENGTPALGLHAGAKTELLLARTLGWLIGAFHSLVSAGKRIRVGIRVKKEQES